MRKKITFWMLLFAMLLMPTIAVKAEENKGVESLLSIKGTVIYKDGVLQEEIPGITYDPETATLTLDHYYEEWVGDVQKESGTYEAGIYSYGIKDLRIEVIGNCSINVYGRYGIYHENPSGERGSLTIETVDIGQGNDGSFNLYVFGKDGVEGYGICVGANTDLRMKAYMHIMAETEYFTGITRESKALNEETEAEFQFLKETVWIGDTHIFNKNLKEICAVDAGSSNVTINNAGIRMETFHENLEKASGIRTGYYDTATGVKRGGCLTLENDAYVRIDTESSAGTIQTYPLSFFKMENTENYKFNIGTRKEPEYVTFDKVFTWNEERQCYESKMQYLDISLKRDESLVYEDVSTSDWFWGYVKYVYDEQLMTGLDEKHFGPTEPLARAQFAVILYRMSGEPEVSYSNKFPDVADGLWYTDAIMWASENGIVNGYTDTGLFGPGDKINREQMAVMMYRYAKYCGYDVESEDFSGILYRFTDGNSVNVFAREAMECIVGKGIISGKDNGTKLDPQGNAIRAECAAIIARYSTTLWN